MGTGFWSHRICPAKERLSRIGFHGRVEFPTGEQPDHGLKKVQKVCCITPGPVRRPFVNGAKHLRRPSVAFPLAMVTSAMEKRTKD